ncbi:MAG TPA: hypothetical protein VG755_05495, partial [Nannocystaceae bacterium]|nr:hypothetical protein [Nannocystaceae bacterium]
MAKGRKSSGGSDEQVEVLHAIWNELKGLNSRVERTNERLEQTNERLEQTNERLESLERGQSETNRRLD